MEKKFRLISFIFLIGCIVFYGARFGYYYLKFNKKASNNSSSEVLSATIGKDNKIVTKGDGLYENNGELVFKGKNVNNYLIYSNILWRIVKVNNDNSVVLITDSKLTDLSFDKSSTDFTKSNINDWLNESGDNTGIFETKLNDKHKYLMTNTICLDSVTDLKKITCKKKDTSKYITLLNVADYLNSKNTDSYINNTDSIWTVTSKDNTKLWFVSKGNISEDTNTNIHGVKAVITLKNSIGKTSGKGTKDDPYTIEDKQKDISFNSYVKLGNDLYQVYDYNDKIIKLVNTSLINDIQTRYTSYNSTEFNPKSNYSVAQYLNNTYYNSLSYKSNLVDCDYYTGGYNTDYKDVFKNKVTTKIGELSIVDVNTDNTNTNYFLLNKHNNIVMSVNDGSSTTNKIKTTVCINKATKFKGNGTKTNPFELEG